MYLGFAAPLFGALAGFGAWINLFNLVPVWQLDGSRAYAALSRAQRAWCAAFALACAVYTGDIILYAIALFGGMRALTSKVDATPSEGDAPTLRSFLGTLAILTLLLSATQGLREP